MQPGPCQPYAIKKNFRYQIGCVTCLDAYMQTFWRNATMRRSYLFSTSLLTDYCALHEKSIIASCTKPLGFLLESTKLCSTASPAYGLQSSHRMPSSVSHFAYCVLNTSAGSNPIRSSLILATWFNGIKKNNLLIICTAKKNSQQF